MSKLEQIKSDMLEYKRRVILDLEEIPETEAGSAHFWNAAASLEQAINHLTLCIEAERKG